MYRYETHLHTFPVSRCAKASVEESLRFYKSIGYDGVFITNHFVDGNINIDKALPYEEQINFYFSDYEKALELSEEIGIKVFLGIELSYKGTDFLVYGLDKKWFLSHPEITTMKKSDELKLMIENGALIFQAHPFRNRTTVMDTDLMDGIEINCHPKYGKTYTKELLQIAEENRLIVTCGGDFHADTYHPTCGMYLPDSIKDHKDLLTYLLSPQEKKLCVQEPNCDTLDTISVKAFHCV